MRTEDFSVMPVAGGQFTAAPGNSRNPHWRDYILSLYEYFHGDNGAELGASHQTGWTGLIARAIDLFARLPPKRRCVLLSGQWRK